MTHTRHAIHYAVRGAVFLLVVVLFGCTTGNGERTPDSIDVLLPSPEDQVRAAVIQVLTEDGYSIRNSADQEGVISTEYREEINGIWDRLLVHSFGVDRSRVDASLTPEDQTHTRLNIQVTYEARSHFWSSWQAEGPAALARNPATQVRRVKKALGLL
jgi:hypothetical protein